MQPTCIKCGATENIKKIVWDFYFCPVCEGEAMELVTQWIGF